MTPATNVLEAPIETALGNGRPAAADLYEIPLDQLHESPKNPRKHYEPHALQQLADNFTAMGQITPIVVRPRPAGRIEFGLTAGRWAVKDREGKTHATRDAQGLDESIDKAVAARWAAQRKAEKKAAAKAEGVQTSGKAKRLAGDVRREKKAKTKKVARG